MPRAIAGLFLVLVIAAATWLHWRYADSQTPTVPSRENAQSGDPVPSSDHTAAQTTDDRTASASERQRDARVANQRDLDIAARLGNVRAMQTQLAGVVDAYCAAHHAMPARIDDIAIPNMPGSFLVDRIDLRDGGIALHLPASELFAAGTIDAVPTLDGACAREWRCQSADFDAIAAWIPGCRYVGAPSGT